MSSQAQAQSPAFVSLRVRLSHDGSARVYAEFEGCEVDADAYFVTHDREIEITRHAVCQRAAWDEDGFTLTPPAEGVFEGYLVNIEDEIAAAIEAELEAEAREAKGERLFEDRAW